MTKFRVGNLVQVVDPKFLAYGTIGRITYISGSNAKKLAELNILLKGTTQWCRDRNDLTQIVVYVHRLGLLDDANDI